jgi:hypothetical protein
MALRLSEESRKIRVCTLMPDDHDTPLLHHAADYGGQGATPPPPVHANLGIPGLESRG